MIKYFVIRNFRGTCTSAEMLKGYMVREKLGIPLLDHENTDNAVYRKGTFTSFERTGNPIPPPRRPVLRMFFSLFQWEYAWTQLKVWPWQISIFYANLRECFQATRHRMGDAAESEFWLQMVLLGDRFRVSDASSIQHIRSKSLHVKCRKRLKQDSEKATTDADYTNKRALAHELHWTESFFQYSRCTTVEVAHVLYFCFFNSLKGFKLCNLSRLMA